MIESTQDELREAGIDHARAQSLLDEAVLALQSRNLLLVRQMPGMRTGQPAYLVQFQWPGCVRVLAFRSKAVIVESMNGEPLQISSATRIDKPVDRAALADERDPSALARARQLRQRRAREMRPRYVAGDGE